VVEGYQVSTGLKRARQIKSMPVSIGITKIQKWYSSLPAHLHQNILELLIKNDFGRRCDNKKKMTWRVTELRNWDVPKNNRVDEKHSKRVRKNFSVTAA
jgi:chitinase